MDESRATAAVDLVRRPHAEVSLAFGGDRVGKVEVDFFSGPKPTGTHHEPSVALRADKEAFGASRRARWFAM